MKFKLSKKSIWLVCVWLLLQACTNNEITNQVPQPIPIPSNPCSPNFQYGYTDKSSYFSGEKVVVFLQSNATIPSCKIDLYDVNGMVVFSVGSGLFAQTIAANASENGYGFSPTVSFEVPSNLKSGIYLIGNQIPIVIKTNSQVDIMVVYPDNTANAYEKSGGKSLYSTDNRPIKVSFMRPIALQNNTTFCLKWFTSVQNVSIGYIADRDLDNYTSVERARLIVIPGHSEYWTRKARENFDRFVDVGGHALILSGNTMWWQVRYSENGNEMYCYRDLALDPIQDSKLKTINWYESLLEYPITKSIGADFNNGGYGLKVDSGWDGYKITAINSPLLKGLNIKKGDIIRLPSGEYDGAPIIGWDADGNPLIDKDGLKFHKSELIGYDFGSRFEKQTIGTFIVFQKTPTSGVVVNTASYDWCSANGMGGSDSEKIKVITQNAITKLLNGETVFSN